MLAAPLAALAALAATLAALVRVVNVVATERVTVLAVLAVLAHHGRVVVAAVLAGYSVAAVATSQGHFIIFIP